MNLKQKIEKILDNWEGTRVVEKHFGDGDELIAELKKLIFDQFSEGDSQPEIAIEKNSFDLTLKELLRDQILDENNEIEWYSLDAYDWPDEDDEPICLENVRVIEFTKDKLVIVGGGDWQNGCVMTIEAINGKLIVTHVDWNNFPDKDMKDDDVLKELLNDN